MSQHYEDLPPGRPPPYQAVEGTSRTASAYEKSADGRSLGTSEASFSPVDEDDEVLQTALDFSHHPPPAQISRQRLPVPVAIPQVSGTMGMPFVRAYPHSLRDHGVSMIEFVEFIDNFNIISASSPLLQVLDLASGAIGMIPMGHAQAISGGLQALVKIGNVAQMKTRASLFVKKSNSDFFGPRGLKVELLTSAALKAKLGLNPETPLVGDIEQSDWLSAIERKLSGLQGYIAPVIFDVPAPNQPTNMLSQITAKQQLNNAKRADRKALESRQKHLEKSEKKEDKHGKRSEKFDEEIAKLDREREKIEQKRDREMEKVARKEKDERKRVREEEKVAREFEEDMRKLEEDYENVRDKFEERVEKRAAKGEEKKGKRDRKDKEAKRAEKGVWLVIDSL